MIKIGLEIPQDKIVYKWFLLMIEDFLLDKNIEIVGVRYRKSLKKDKTNYGVFNLVQKQLFKRNLKKKKIDNLLELVRFNKNITISENVKPDLYIACGTDINYQERDLSSNILRFFLDGIPFETYSSGIKNTNIESGINIECYIFSSKGTYKSDLCKIKIARLFLMTKNNIGNKLPMLVYYIISHPMIWIEVKNIRRKNYNFLTMEYFLLLSYMNAIRRYKLKKYKRKWYLYFKNYRKLDMSLFSNIDIEQWEKIEMPDDVFWADPICVHSDNRDYIFVEEYQYNEKKGCIAVFEYTDAGYKYLGIVLKRSYHLSFPFIFSFEDKYYMIPESSANQTVELYECVEFPMKWKFYKNIFQNKRECDTVLFFYGDLWWMFTTLELNNWGYDEQLYLYYAENPIEGKWVSHPQNPIVLGADCARMAGAIICIDNKIIRPAQDCLKFYGDKMRLFEVIKLTTDAYEEKEIGLVEINNKGVVGTHTLCINNNDLIIDVQKRE